MVNALSMSRMFSLTKDESVTRFGRWTVSWCLEGAFAQNRL